MENMNNRVNVESTQEPVNGQPVQTPVDAGEVDMGEQVMTVNNRRMLFRHPTEQVLGGVCGGVADYINWDPALVRILWVVATLATGGGGILAYIALWALLPVGTAATGQQRPAAIGLNDRNLSRAAVLLIGLGLLWLLANMGVLPWMWGGVARVMRIFFWPVLLIGAGYLILRYTGKGDWKWGATTTRVKESVGERMPTTERMKSGFSRARQSFPLKRSRTDKLFMGVCGAIGQKLGIDSNLVRLIWAAFSIGSIGMGVLLYVLTGLLLPEEEVADVVVFDERDQDVQIIDGRRTNGPS
jgi:phage shock protein C